MIEKGKEWGEPGIVPSAIISILTDKQLAQSATSDVFALRGGDLFRSVGQPRELHSGDPCVVVPIDAMECELTVSNEAVIVVAASSIIIGQWWRHSWIALTNAGWTDSLNIAPRSHPNDGRCEMLEFAREMPLRQRIIARKKMRTGTHVPHPQITARTVREASFDISRSSKVKIDGVKFSGVTHVSMRVIPDYWRIVI
jgi:hypothetical protein